MLLMPLPGHAQQSELHSGVGHFVDRVIHTATGKSTGSVFEWTYGWNEGNAVDYREFQTGNHLKEFKLCGDGDGIQLVNDNEVEFFFHWDSIHHCDLVTDIVLHTNKPVGWVQP